MDKKGLVYNTERKDIIISEYGRNMQEMIRHLLEIEDRQKRTEAANFIINVMIQMNPQVKDSSDYMHKLWDHLYIISDYQLDVDSPYDPPKPVSATTKPHHVDYSNHNIKYGHYGQYMVKMIELATKEENPETREALAYSIANQMKRNYLEWNGNVVNDQQIINDLKEMSNGILVLDEETKLNGTAEILSKPVLSQKQNNNPGDTTATKKKKKKKQSNPKADMNNPNNPAYKKRMQQTK